MEVECARALMHARDILRTVGITGFDATANIATLLTLRELETQYPNLTDPGAFVLERAHAALKPTHNKGIVCFSALVEQVSQQAEKNTSVGFAETVRDVIRLLQCHKKAREATYDVLKAITALLPVPTGSLIRTRGCTRASSSARAMIGRWKSSNFATGKTDCASTRAARSGSANISASVRTTTCTRDIPGAVVGTRVPARTTRTARGSSGRRVASCAQSAMHSNFIMAALPTLAAAYHLSCTSTRRPSSMPTTSTPRSAVATPASPPCKSRRVFRGSIAQHAPPVARAYSCSTCKPSALASVGLAPTRATVAA